MKTGIYRIRNTTNGKCYVGQAQDIAGRWASHRSKLRKGTHRSRKLQRSWDKHGADVFVFEVITECVVAELDALEQHYIDTLGAFGHSGYNMRPIAQSNRGHRYSEESCRRISESKRLAFAADPTLAARQSAAALRTFAERPHLTQQHSERLKAMYVANPEKRTQMSNKVKAAHEADTGLANRLSEAQKKSHASNPNLAKASSERNKAIWADPDRKAAILLKKRFTTASNKLVIIGNPARRRRPPRTAGRKTVVVPPMTD